MSKAVNIEIFRTWTLPSTREVASLRTSLEALTDQVFSHSLEVAKFEKEHLDGGIRRRQLCQVLPPLRGAYSVGSASFIIEGPKKRGYDGDRTIGVEIYAPTRVIKGKRLLLELPAKNLDRVLSNAQIKTLQTHSYAEFEPLIKSPIIIFSHGLMTDPSEYRLLLEEIASHGYLVLNLNHPSSSAYAPFSEESLCARKIDLEALERSNPEGYSKELNNLSVKQVANLHFVIRQIKEGKLVQEMGNSEQIILAGHSLGGSSSIQVARSNHHVCGCVNLDGMLRGSNKTGGLTVPLLQIFADHLKDEAQVPEKEQEEFNKWKNFEYRQMLNDWGALHKNSKYSRLGQIKETSHMDFCTEPFLKWLAGGDTLYAALKAQQVASKEIVKFFQKSLR